MRVCVCAQWRVPTRWLRAFFFFFFPLQPPGSHSSRKMDAASFPLHLRDSSQEVICIRAHSERRVHQTAPATYPQLQDVAGQRGGGGLLRSVLLTVCTAASCSHQATLHRSRAAVQASLCVSMSNALISSGACFASYHLFILLILLLILLHRCLQVRFNTSCGAAVVHQQFRVILPETCRSYSHFLSMRCCLVV